jgi:hypothetical protein
VKERPGSLRAVWRDHIRTEDYERHMAANGQAQANASLLQDLFLNYAPPLGARVLFAGAGAGQCFDYLPTNLLGRYRTTFADISPVYLDRLSQRVTGVDYSTVVDDIEDSRLAGPFDLAIVILVLEHVDWRRAVDCLTRQAARVFTVIQQNPAELPASRLEGTLAVLEEVPPTLVDPAALIGAFDARAFRCYRTDRRAVAGGKTMLALDFLRDTR